MAQTTAAINACDVVVKLDDAAGVAVDLSGSSNQIQMRLTNDLGAFKTFGSRFRVRLECGSDAELSFRAVYSVVDAEAARTLLRWYFTDRGSRTFTFDVPSSAGGGDRFTFEVFLESLNVPLDGEDANPTPVEAVMRPTGTFSMSAIAS